MKKYYDACVIGTSPISLLIAIKLSKSNKKIIIVEKDSINGGAWSNEIITHLDEVKLETSCHLIEHYNNVYKKISELSGVFFKICEPQPIKILRGGKIKNYFCIYEETGKIVRQVAILFVLPFIKFANFFFPNNIQRGQHLRLKNVIKLVKFNFRYKLSSFFSFNGIMEPEFGYANFIDQLIFQVKKNNIEINTAEFIDVFKMNNKNLEIVITNDKIEAKKIYLPESTEIRKESNLANIINISNSFIKHNYWHVVIEIKEKIKKKIPNYIHFPDDNLLHRMTKDNQINVKIKRNIFLLQTRISPLSINQEILYKKVVEIFTLLGIFVKQENITIHHFFEKSLFSSHKDSIFCNSKTSENIVIIKSIGDLAKNVALNPLFND